MRLLESTFACIRTVLAALALGTLALAPQVLAQTPTQKDVYYHNDLAGTPMAATDEAGNVLWRQGYKPYGERLDPKAPAEQLPWYTGKAHVEAAGLSYFGARWYDPLLGRFMGVDPVGFSEANLHSFNRYAYANNNPYKFGDPDGRSASAIAPIIGGAILIGGGYRALPEDATRTIASGLTALGDYSILARLGSMVGQALLSESSSSDQSGSKGQAGDRKPGDKDPSTPTGRRGSPLDVTPGTNEPTSIGGRDYSGHALDRMQGRGVPPSAVEEAIRSGQPAAGKLPGTKVHNSPDGVTVVTGDRGQVVTVIPR